MTFSLGLVVSQSLDIITLAAISLSICALFVAIIIGVTLNNKLTNKYHTSSDVTDVLAIVSEFSQRMKRLEEGLVEQKVKQEILQLRMDRRPQGGAVVEPGTSNYEPPMRSVVVHRPSPLVALKAGQTRLGNTEREVLRMVIEGQGKLSANEIQQKIGKTREHIARMMNSLFREGLVQRDMNARPYSYTITDEGRVVLGS